MAGYSSGHPGRVGGGPPQRPRGSALSLVLLALVLLALYCCAAASATSSQQAGLPTSSSGLPSSDLSASNWTLLLEGEWMVEFFAPWCSACQQIQAEWEKFAQNSMALDITVGKVDVTQEPGLSGRFFVTTLPTIFHAKDGVFRKYRGPRTSEDLQEYIMMRKWEAVEPVTGWKSPSSITMYGMAGLFHLSGWIRQIHSYLTGPLGIPVWGSYIIFIVAILLIGLFFGLILVLLADCICPPKSKYRGERADVNEKETVSASGGEPGQDQEEEEEEEEEDREEGEEDGEDREEKGEEGEVDEEEEEEEEEEELEEEEDEEEEDEEEEEGVGEEERGLPSEQKKDHSDVEGEGKNEHEKSIVKDSGDKDGSKSEKQTDDAPEQHLVDPDPKAESSVRQRKPPVAENEQ